MPKIDLSPDSVTDIDLKLIDEPGPEDELIAQILRSLHFIGLKYEAKKGFWVMAGQIVDWLNANGIKDEDGEPYTSQRVGILLSKPLGLKQRRRVEGGQMRWIPRDRLADLIDKYQDEDVEIQGVIEAGYETVKREVFGLLLEDGDVQELDYDTRLIKEAVKEFNKIGEDGAKRWLEGG
jgi:hypothetical protein